MHVFNQFLLLITSHSSRTGLITNFPKLVVRFGASLSIWMISTDTICFYLFFSNDSVVCFTVDRIFSIIDFVPSLRCQSVFFLLLSFIKRRPLPDETWQLNDSLIHSLFMVSRAALTRLMTFSIWPTLLKPIFVFRFSCFSLVSISFELVGGFCFTIIFVRITFEGRSRWYIQSKNSPHTRTHTHSHQLQGERVQKSCRTNPV